MSSSPKSSLDAALARIKERVANTPPAPAQTIPPERRQLPLWPDLERAIPNHLARSSLFAPIAPGRRKQHDRLVKVSLLKR